MTQLAHHNFINGQWQPSASGATLPNTNPANPADVVGHFPLSNASDVDAAAKAAKAAYASWRLVPPPERANVLYKFADYVKTHKLAWAQTMSREMGKTLTEAKGDVQEAIDMALFVAGEGRRLYGHTTTSELANKFAMTLRLPLGVCGLITPWNFPVAVPSWKLLPALLAGNTVVFKPAEDAPLMGQRLVEAFEAVGLPAGVLNLVQGDGATTGAAMVEHPDICLISFTGSTATGAGIAERCGRLHKRCSLEMGGKNAIIVLDDANLDLAAEGVVWGAFGTSGQRCTATSRLVVHEAVHDALLAKVIAKTQTLVLGDPQEATTQVGPLINARALAKVERYLGIAQEEGATLVLGGQRVAGQAGYYIEPTIYTSVTPTMRIAQEEIFGPVLCVIKVASFDEAIAVANGVDYGLSSAIYTANVSRAFKAMRDLEAGITYINAPTTGAEVHLPFGGVKNTGNGHREAADVVLDTYTEWKTVYVDYSDTLQRAQIDNEA
jgi:aldehyde dehydrogenase (NAD+)